MEGEANIGIYIPTLQVIMKNIQALKDVTLKEGRMGLGDINCLKDPKQACFILDMLDIHLVKVL